jgi:hypothetical protein
MPDPNVRAVGELLNLPVGDLIRSVALGIAEAQFQLDKASMTVAELMSGQRLLRDLDTGKLITPDGEPTDLPVVIDSRIYFGYHYDERGRRVADRLSMMELGFVPTFYQFVDTTIELKLAVRITQVERVGPAAAGGSGSGAAKEARDVKETGSAGWWAGSASEGFVLSSTPVDANYSSAYSFEAQMASTVKTKLVPVPPPPVFEDRIRQLLDARRADEDAARAARAQLSTRGQVTDVEIHVAKTVSHPLVLEIKTGAQPVAGRKLEIATVPDNAEASAEQLAYVLNRELSQVLLAEAKGGKVVISFRDARTYEVTQEGPGTPKTYFTITEVRKAQPDAQQQPAAP